MRIRFLKIHGFLSVVAEIQKVVLLFVSHINVFAALSCSQKRKKPRRPNSWLGAEGSLWFLDFFLQLLFIAQAQEGNGRRGGKACGEKTNMVVGLGCPFPHLSESIELGFPT